MTVQDRQITLETRMYRKKSFGREKFCGHCWACEYHKNCIAYPPQRSVRQFCAKAENRMKGKPTDTELAEVLKNSDKRKRYYLFQNLGLRQSELQER